MQEKLKIEQEKLKREQEKLKRELKKEQEKLKREQEKLEKLKKLKREQEKLKKLKREQEKLKRDQEKLEPEPETILHVVTEDATQAGLLGRAILSNRLPFLNSTSFDSFVIKIGCSSVMLGGQSPPGSRILYLAGINYQEMDWIYSLTKITDAIKLLDCNEIKYLVNTLECTTKCIWNGDAKLNSLCNLKRVSVSGCFKLRQVFPSALLQSLVSLEHIEIDVCDSLEEIFEKEKEEDHQENEIVSLKIDHTATSPCLGNLVFIKISECHKLKNLFTPSIVKGLVHLRTLEVKLCSTLEEIISDEKAETGGSTERITFPCLYRIDLRGLDSLTCFCARRCTIEFPALELLDIKKCPKMETFGRGNQVTPNLVNRIHLDGQKRWTNNLNITLQQFFKERQIVFEQYKQQNNHSRAYAM
ncbi:hypothetical protein LWI28_015930 [Acer negundo]|uniref:Disease resistance protein At4g27190-like leucine-rich repeats domain-containing protein n=1 Tax=Acer negundo TaxID=4023 RepID=A0AAD5NS76_ACENE|nr:hypothetical protein LWI28_015930 [Acer negundo]